MESAGKPNGKRTRHDLTLREKYDVIQKAMQKVTHHNLADEFKCSESQISHIVGNRAEIESNFENNFNSNAKRLKAAPNHDVNEAVWEWFTVVTGKGIPVSSKLFVKFLCRIF